MPSFRLDQWNGGTAMTAMITIVITVVIMARAAANSFTIMARRSPHIF